MRFVIETHSPHRSRTAIRAALGALCLLGSLGISAPAAAGPSTSRVTEVKAAAVGEGAEIVIVSSRPPQYSARVADQGRRLILDLSDAELDGAASAITERAGVVGGVMTQTFKSERGPVTRVILSLLQASTYQVRSEGTALKISLRPAATTGPGAAEERPRAAADKQAQEPAAVREVRFRPGKEVEQVRIDVSGDVSASPAAAAAGRSRLEIRGAKLRPELERTLDVGAFGGRVKSISTYRLPSNPSTVVVEVEHAEGIVGTLQREGGALVWNFARKAEATSAQTGVAPDGGVARRTRTVAREEVSPDVHKIEAGLGEESGGESGAFTSGTLGQQRGAANNGQRRYTGARVDLDLKDADVHNVLRILADVGKVNVVTADNVKGEVTLRLRNVPWDQAMDVVLQAKGLGMTRQGNMIRVAPLADLEKEREMAIARRKQELELAPVETRLIPVSYAEAATMQGRAKELLSSRGSIAVDDRTNVLIVRDVAGNLNQIEELVRSLDTQTPQVLVEARIVEATSRYLRDIGIQWGGDATFSPATGNPTGLAFPSSIGAVGGGSDANTPTAGLSPFTRVVQNPNFAVNLPAAVGTGQGGALGLSFGSLNNAVNLAVRLSAAESSGMLRIVSSPRILTLDNKEATIAQGTLIPFSQISAQGVQTNFQEAKLQLKVRPHVTSDGSISMHVKINRDEPDFNQTSARGDPTILKREAETDLLIMDGHTAVIGGIFTRNTGRNLDQVPFFGDIPLLGVLFQRRRSSDSRSELVIFLSPRIVNRAEALGRLSSPGTHPGAGASCPHRSPAFAGLLRFHRVPSRPFIGADRGPRWRAATCGGSLARWVNHEPSPQSREAAWLFRCPSTCLAALLRGLPRRYSWGMQPIGSKGGRRAPCWGCLVLGAVQATLGCTAQRPAETAPPQEESATRFVAAAPRVVLPSPPSPPPGVDPEIGLRYAGVCPRFRKVPRAADDCSERSPNTACYGRPPELELNDGRRVRLGHRAIEESPGKEGAAGATRKTPWMVEELPISREKAKYARGLRSEGVAPMYGPPELVRLRDEQAEEAWAMVWVEVVPPPHGWPRGKPYREAKKGAKNGCGGHGIESRSLADPGVEKKIHITRFLRTQMLSDRVVLSFNCFDPRRERLTVQATPAGVEVNGIVYDRKGKVVAQKEAALLPRTPLAGRPRLQELRAIGYDEGSRTGVVLISEGPDCFRQEFDQVGEPVGLPVWLPDACTGFNPASALVRTRQGWVGLLQPDPRSFGASDPPDTGNKPALVELDDRPPTRLLSLDRGETLDVPAGTVAIGSRAGELVFSSEEDPCGRVFFWPPEQPAMMLSAPRFREEEQTFPPLQSGEAPRCNWQPVRVAASAPDEPRWSPIAEAPRASVLLVVPGDLIALTVGDVSFEALWLKSGEKFTFVERLVSSWDVTAVPRGLPQSLLQAVSGWAAAPPKPGPMVPVEGIAEREPVLRSFYTSERTILVVGISEKKPDQDRHIVFRLLTLS